MLNSRTRRDLIQAGGNLCRQAGLPRSLGQIYALLFLSPRPLSLEDMTVALGISKGSASVGTRQLAAWGAIRHVWMPGTRRDHFEAVADLGSILRRAYQDFVKPRLTSAERRYLQLVEGMSEDVRDGSLSAEDAEFCAQRLKKLDRVQRQIHSIVPVLEGLL
ncbi:MAG: hypothetical protein H7A47_09810 [Verrucomicrobiales bacterium]|nr:hypothetical protein [Verrucomicrobiales bacterium]